MISSTLDSLKNLTSSIGNKISTTIGIGGEIPSISGIFLLADFCMPAKFYALIAFLTLLYLIIINDNIWWIIVKAITFIVWTFLLQKMCKMRFTAIAWLTAIVPHGIFLLVTVKTT